ncbi:PRTRC system protein C [Xanthocytophaga flava]|uniref:PRTRC system protein C n=1 Tax=Xanthocytophaga flava TaxID=3048013 RepID=UPI0028D6240F|nr:PRTRC system protein C [Xanthocytophaga flavus]
MILLTQTLTRKFQLKKNGNVIELNDPNSSFSPEEVMSFYANMYSELTTATVYGPEVKEKELLYEFKTTVGVKG